MSSYQLSVTPRKRDQRIKGLLQRGYIPGVVYGPGFTPASISMNAKEFTKIIQEAGTSQIIDLSLEGSAIPTLMHEFQRDPITGLVTHVDFYHVTKGHKVSAMIPLVFVGISQGVKDKGGTLVTHLREVQVEGLPEKLPASLEVDITGLQDFGNEITLKDLPIPADITFLGDFETSVVSLLAPQGEEKKEEPVVEEAEVQPQKPGEGEVK